MFRVNSVVHLGCGHSIQELNDLPISWEALGESVVIEQSKIDKV